MQSALLYYVYLAKFKENKILFNGKGIAVGSKRFKFVIGLTYLYLQRCSVHNLKKMSCI